MNENLELEARQLAVIKERTLSLPLIQHQIPEIQAATYSYSASKFTLQSLQPLYSSSQLPKQVDNNIIKTAACNCTGGNGILTQSVYLLGLLALFFYFRQRRKRNQS